MSEPRPDRRAPSPGGRRSSAPAGRRVDATAVLALVLPLATLALLLGTSFEHEPPADRPPRETPLELATLVCPSASAGTTPVAVATTGDRSGRVDVGPRGEQEPVRVDPGRRQEVRDRAPVLVQAEGALAPGLVAARTGTAPVTAVDCTPPDPDQWFTGVGAGARHSSVLELVNPDAGPAVADVTVLGRTGPVAVPALRGVVVPGGSSVRLDLAQVVPRRDELALRVTTTRGRLRASVLDRTDELGSGSRGQDWLAGQAVPGTRTLLLGLTSSDEARHTLLVANGGDDEVRATVRVVTEESVLTPRDLDEITVPPGTVQQVSLSGLLAATVADGAVGLQVDATGPVTTTLRSVSDGDLTHAVPGPRVGEDGTVALVPAGDKRLVLAGADGVGAVRVVARDASGKVLAEERAEVTPDRGTVVRLPRGAVLVEVRPERVTLEGALLTEGDGAAVVRLREPVRSGLVPDVRPGLG